MPSVEGDAAEEKSSTTGKLKDVAFQIHNVSLEIPRGALWAVVGPVGSGKSSLLQGLIGGKFIFRLDGKGLML